MRTVFWLTSVTLVAGAVATIAVADYVYRHPTSVLGRWMARVVDGKSEVDPRPDRPRYSPSVPVTPSPAELEAMAQLAGIEEPQAPRFPDTSDLDIPIRNSSFTVEPPRFEPDHLDGVVVSLNSGVVTSDLDIPIRNSSFTPAPASPTESPMSQAALRQIEQIKQEYGGRGYKSHEPKEDNDAVPPPLSPKLLPLPPPSEDDPPGLPNLAPPPATKLGVAPSAPVRVNEPDDADDIFRFWLTFSSFQSSKEEVEVLTVMPRRIPQTERWFDEQGRERIGIDFEVELLPHPVKELFEEKVCVDCPACPCLSICKSLGHCLFGWMVGMDCLEDCRYAGVQCPGKACHEESGAEMSVNGVCPNPWRMVRVKAVARPACFDRSISVDYRNKPLHEVLDDLRDQTGLNIVADRPSLEQEGVSLDRCVHIQLKHVKLDKALELILRDAHACYTMEDGILLVTTPKAAKGKLGTNVYHVADLVIAPDGKDRIDSLIKLITHTVEPSSWDEMGGPGHVDYYPLGMSLVVRQTGDVQEQVQLLLDRLREFTVQAADGKAACVKVTQQTCTVRDLPRGCIGDVILPNPVGNPQAPRDLEIDCFVPYCEEPCVNDDYIEMEAEEVELDLGKVKLRCKGFRLTAPTRVIGMLKGCDPDFVSGEACWAKSPMTSCKQGCSEEEEEDLVAEFMKYEPNDLSAEEPCADTCPELADLEALLRKFDQRWSSEPETPEKLPVCEEPCFQVADPPRVLEFAKRLILYWEIKRQMRSQDDDPAGAAVEPKTPEKLPVCDHPAICPAVGGRAIPREEQDRPLPEEEVIQADFETPLSGTSKPAANMPGWDFPIPLWWYDTARVGLGATPRPYRTCWGADNSPPPLFHDTSRDAFVLLKLEWMNDLHPAVRLTVEWPAEVTSSTLELPAWAEDVLAPARWDQECEPDEVFTTGPRRFLPRIRPLLGEVPMPAGIADPDLTFGIDPTDPLQVPGWVKPVIEPKRSADDDIFSFWVSFFR